MVSNIRQALPPGAGPRSHALMSVPSAAFSPALLLGQMPITLNPSVQVCVSHRQGLTRRSLLQLNQTVCSYFTSAPPEHLCLMRASKMEFVTAVRPCPALIALTVFDLQAGGPVPVQQLIRPAR